jgi:hypothetical protein
VEVSLNKIIGLIAVISLLLIVSGCMNTAPNSTLTPTATSTETPAATPTQIMPAPTATPVPTAKSEITAAKPSIKVTFYSTSVTGESNFTVNWEVSGGTPGTISKTMILWGYKSGSGNITEYPRNSMVQTGQTPGKFSAEQKAPAGGGPIYFRVYAIVDGFDIYSSEYQITIIPRYTGGGGGGGGY